MYSDNVSRSTEYFLNVTETKMTIPEINEYQDSTSVSESFVEDSSNKFQVIA